MGVGKTSIISRYINNKYEEKICLPTAGASYSTKSMHLAEYDKYVKYEVANILTIRSGILQVKRYIILWPRFFIEVFIICYQQVQVL